jgi:hypothetical protein
MVYHVHTNVAATTRSYIGTLASASANPAQVIEAARAEPSFSRTNAYTSTWKLGNSCYKEKKVFISVFWSH